MEDQTINPEDVGNAEDILGLNDAPEAPVVEPTETVEKEAPVAVKIKEHGIQNTKELIQMGAATAKIIKQAKENDGAYSAMDLPLLINLFPTMGPALDDIASVPAELKDLDADELKELLQFGAAHIGEAYSDSPALIAKVEAVLGVGLAIAKAVKAFG